MKNLIIIEQIKLKSVENNFKRNDIRFKRAMAFLVKKGFLKTDFNYRSYYTNKIKLSDFIWAGKNLEPRILEVLPSALARLPKAFILDQSAEAVLLSQIVNDLKQNRDVGSSFMGVDYAKFKIWMNLPLADKRTKLASQKKITKTFRLNINTILKLKQLKQDNGQSEAAIIDNLILKY